MLLDKMYLSIFVNICVCYVVKKKDRRMVYRMFLFIVLFFFCILNDLIFYKIVYL